MGLVLGVGKRPMQEARGYMGRYLGYEVIDHCRAERRGALCSTVRKVDFRIVERL